MSFSFKGFQSTIWPIFVDLVSKLFKDLQAPDSEGNAKRKNGMSEDGGSELWWISNNL